MIVFADAVRRVPGNPGKAWVCRYPGARVAKLIRLSGWPEATLDIMSIITDFQLEMGGNHQILHTLGQRVFVYNFGDRAGIARISGLSFPEVCTSAHADRISTIPVRTGIERLYEYYFQNRLTNRRDPLVLVLGSQTAFNILLHDLMIENVGQNDMCRFHLVATILPF